MNYNKLEDEIYDYINLARTKPYMLSKDLAAMLPYFNGNKFKAPGMSVTLVTTEGATAVQEAIEVVNSQKPTGILFSSQGMKQAAKDHCFDIGKHGLVSHIGTDGSRMSDRINRYGTWYSSIAENISFGETTAKEIVLNFLIDDGNAQRGHRATILNPQLKFVGISCGPHNTLKTCCVIDFAGDFDESGTNVNTAERHVKREVYQVQREARHTPDKYGFGNARDRSFERARERSFERRVQEKSSEKLPPGVKSCRTKKTVTQEGKKKTTVFEKIYTMEDGSTKRVEETEVTYD